MQKVKDAFDIAWFALRIHLSGAWRIYAAGIAMLAIIIGGLWHSLAAPPANAAEGIVVVPSGQPLSVVAADLAAARVIRSPLMLKALLALSGHERGIQAGSYEFKTGESVFTVARRIAAGDTQIVPIRVTLIEGMASFDMARVLAADIPGFDSAEFETLAAPHEGYLFPDTYFFLPNVSPQQVVRELTANFNARLASIGPSINASGHSLEDIMTMASIVEREAQTPADRRLVTGVLWHRISINMRLQVDAVFGYLHEQDAYEPTASDLASLSPYNTYRNAGLPPGPISNPGLDAIEAAADPTPSGYLYYLSDPSGTIHYAKTFDEHQQNRALYLK